MHHASGFITYASIHTIPSIYYAHDFQSNPVAILVSYQYCHHCEIATRWSSCISLFKRYLSQHCILHAFCFLYNRILFLVFLSVTTKRMKHIHSYPCLMQFSLQCLCLLALCSDMTSADSDSMPCQRSRTLFTPFNSLRIAIYLFPYSGLKRIALYLFAYFGLKRFTIYYTYSHILV